MKKYFKYILLTFILIIGFTLNVRAFTGPSTFDEYMLNAVQNNSWITTSKGNMTTITIKLGSLNDSNFTKAYKSINEKKVEFLLFACTSADCGENNADSSKSVKLKITKLSDTASTLFLEGSTLYYNNLIQNNMFYMYTLDGSNWKKGTISKITKITSSSAQGTISNPFVITNSNKCFNVPTQGEEVYFKISGRDYGRYEIKYGSTTGNTKNNTNIVVQNDNSSNTFGYDSLYDSQKTSYIGLTSNGLYHFNLTNNPIDLHGQKICITYKDSKPLNVDNSGQEQKAGDELGKDNVNNKNKNKDNNGRVEQNTKIINLVNICNEDKNIAKVMRVIGYLLFIVKILIPIGLIVGGIINFSRAMLSGNDDDLKKKAINFAWNIIAAAAVFILPTVINFIISLVDGSAINDSNFSNCRVCIFDPKNCKIPE